MFDYFGDKNRLNRYAVDAAHLTDYEWLTKRKWSDIPHWLCGGKDEITYCAIDFEFEVQYSNDGSCWQYMYRRAGCLVISSPIYPATKKPSLRHFRRWALS